MKKTVIVDIDGTVANPGERLKYLKMDPPDYDSFYEDSFKDEPIQNVVDIVKQLQFSWNVIFCTSRRECVRGKTAQWLHKHGLLHPLYENSHYLLLMRSNGDRRHDIEVKPGLLKKAGIELSDIAFVLEDRGSMVKHWREMGLTVFQVAEGSF